MNASMSCELMLLGKLPSTIRTLKIKKNENEKTFSHNSYAQKYSMVKENFNPDFSTTHSSNTWG